MPPGAEARSVNFGGFNQLGAKDIIHSYCAPGEAKGLAEA